MCELCDPQTGEQGSCQDCGKMICFDTEEEDDIWAPAFVTSSGDVFCRRCGLKREAALEEDEEEPWETEAGWILGENGP